MNLVLQCPEGQQLAVEAGGELVVGSDPGCAVHLRGGCVPAKLAVVRFGFGEAWLQVLATDPPVAVNGRPIQALARLAAGDRVCFGAFCTELVGQSPEGRAPTEPIASFCLRVRGGHGNGAVLHGPVLHLDEGGQPAAETAATASLFLAEQRLVLEPGHGTGVMRVNGWSLAGRTDLIGGDQVQVGPRRFHVDTLGLPCTPVAVAGERDPQNSGAREDAEPLRADPSQNGLWWLIGVSALIAAAVAALLYFHG